MDASQSTGVMSTLSLLLRQCDVLDCEPVRWTMHPAIVQAMCDLLDIANEGPILIMGLPVFRSDHATSAVTLLCSDGKEYAL